MSTTPFRTAFWALGLSLAMTVTLLVPNPQRIRSAFRAHRQLSHQQTLLARLPAVRAETAIVAEPQREEVKTELPAEPLVAMTEVNSAAAPEIPDPPVPQKPADVRSSGAPVPVRVASADLTAPLGFGDPSPGGESTRAVAAPVPAPTAVEVAISIPVPEPVVQEAAKSQPPRPLPWAPPPEEKNIEKIAPLPQLASQSTEKPVPPPFPEERKVEVPESPATQTTAEPGTHRYSFQFVGQPLAEVLREIGRQAGWSVIVDPAVQGNYSGEFVDADPAQAFALIVKTHNCSVHRRGAFLLIGPRSASSVR